MANNIEPMHATVRNVVPVEGFLFACKQSKSLWLKNLRIPSGGLSRPLIKSLDIEPYSTIGHQEMKEPRVVSWHKCGTSDFEVSLYPKPNKL